MATPSKGPQTGAADQGAEAAEASAKAARKRKAIEQAVEEEMDLPTAAAFASLPQDYGPGAAERLAGEGAKEDAAPDGEELPCPPEEDILPVAGQEGAWRTRAPDGDGALYLWGTPKKSAAQTPYRHWWTEEEYRWGNYPDAAAVLEVAGWPGDYWTTRHPNGDWLYLWGVSKDAAAGTALSAWKGRWELEQAAAARTAAEGPAAAEAAGGPAAVRRAGEVLVCGHGARTSPATFVPQGMTVLFYAELDKMIPKAFASLAVRAKADPAQSPDGRVYGPLAEIPNYAFTAVTQEEVPLILTATDTAVDQWWFIGMNPEAPDGTALCGTPDTCTRPEHTCTGLLAKKVRKLTVTACRGLQSTALERKKPAPEELSQLVHDPELGTEYTRYVGRIEGLLRKNKTANAMKVLASLPAATRAGIIRSSDTIRLEYRYQNGNPLNYKTFKEIGLAESLRGLNKAIRDWNQMSTATAHSTTWTAAASFPEARDLAVAIRYQVTSINSMLPTLGKTDKDDRWWTRALQPAGRFPVLLETLRKLDTATLFTPAARQQLNPAEKQAGEEILAYAEKVRTAVGKLTGLTRTEKKEP